jgi:ATP-dependent RNA/DNA helicase IGHMBP2
VPSTSYFTTLQNALALERATDRELFKKLLSTQSPHHRRLAGISWYPIVIKDVEPAMADYCFVSLERANGLNEPHQLRSGMPIELFSAHNEKEDRIQGTISYLSGNKMKIHLRTDDTPEWTRNGKLGIDALFDENSYDEMEAALKKAIKLEDDKDERLIQVLINNKKAGFQEELVIDKINTLNSSQNEAVHKILSAHELAIVHGPPGTGKTTTLVQAIKGLLALGEKQILVTAPSNTAVDLMSERLSLAGVRVLRIGNPVRIGEEIQKLTLDYKIQNSEEFKQIKKLKKQAQEFKDMAHKYKRNFGRDEREQRKLLFKEAANIYEQMQQLESYITTSAISSAQVIATTLVGTQNYQIRDKEYDAVVIDEAGQALEPACWIPILKAKKVILAGDHLQLPPTVKSSGDTKAILEKTMMERLVEQQPHSVILLKEQYRMHEQIMRISAAQFYNNELIANEAVASRKLLQEQAAVQFIDTAGCGFEEVIEGTAINNPEEARILWSHLSQCLSMMPDAKASNIAIISPYKSQVKFLQELLDNDSEMQGHNISINTIDGFQGQEKDIVYISLVRSNVDGNIGFLNELRRMNVAITRAKQLLVIVGDSATLAQVKFYDDLINYCQQIEGWHSAWEYFT